MMSDFARALLLYLALLAGCGALISGEIAIAAIMLPAETLELAEVQP